MHIKYIMMHQTNIQHYFRKQEKMNTKKNHTLAEWKTRQSWLSMLFYCKKQSNLCNQPSITKSFLYVN